MTAVPRTGAAVPVILRENTSQLPTLSRLHPEPATVGTWLRLQVAERLAGSPAGFSHVSWGLGQVAPVQDFQQITGNCRLVQRWRAQVRWTSHSIGLKGSGLGKDLTRSQTERLARASSTFPRWVSCSSSAQGSSNLPNRGPDQRDGLGKYISARVQSVRSDNDSTSEVN